MNEATTPRGQIRGLRRLHQWSQEDLAEHAELSVTTIKKAEAGGHVTTKTLHCIARALGAETSDLYANAAIAPRLDAEPDHHALARLRAVISPPVGINGTPLLDDAPGPVNLAAIQDAVARTEEKYRVDRYDEVADTLPDIITDAHRAVAELDSDGAYRARAIALQMAGRYLTQVRQLSDALTAIRASIRDAAQAGERTLAAVAISGQGWALTRQGRLEEAERLCVLTADEIEPRMSSATPAELAAWGHLLFRASAAAVRNNAHDRARDQLRVAGAAASALGRETDCWATFGPLTMAHKSAEFSLIEGKPDHTLRESKRLPDPQDVGDVTPINWERHRLDVAHALVMTGDVEQSTGVMTAVMGRSPEWLRRQTEAYQVVSEIMEARPKRPTDEMAALATHLRVAL